jgi:hypothetical protein
VVLGKRQLLQDFHVDAIAFLACAGTVYFVYRRIQHEENVFNLSGSGADSMEKAKRSIFYSWQSDLDGKTTRSFIEDALRRAIKALRKDDTLDVEPVIDRDTKDVPGSPDIAKTILAKIGRAQIFVGDVSIINKGAKRLTPNPNVVYELGYARRALGDEYIIMVMNTAYGVQPDLPFDLRQHRAIGFYLPKEIDDESLPRTDIRKNLENSLREHILAILRLDEPQPEEKTVSLVDQVRTAIEEGRSNKASALVKQFMRELADAIAMKTPVYTTDNPITFVNHDLDKLLLQAIGALHGSVLEFTQLAEIIAQMDAVEAARAMYAGFENILMLYTFSPPARITRSPRPDHDLARFFGHELFVTFFALLIREGRWGLIADLLDEDLYARKDDFQAKADVPFYRLSALVMSFNPGYSNHLKPKSPSYHADILQERHTQGDLAKYVTIEQFAEADFFLYLRAQVQETETPNTSALCFPWSWPYLQQIPRYLQKARRGKYAQQLLLPLRIEDISTLRDRLKERTAPLTRILANGPWTYVIEAFDFNAIGSQ